MSGRPRLVALAAAGRPNRTLPIVGGRWSLVLPAEVDPTVRAHAAAEILLDRHGIVTRGSVVAEDTPGGFAAMYRVLSAFEESGRVRRGYFVEGLGAAQFGSAGAVDRLRAITSTDPTGQQFGLVLAAADPANPYGAALPWPERREVSDAHRPARRAGAIVALLDGDLVLYAERGGRSLLTFTDDGDRLRAAAAGVAGLVRQGRIAGMTVTRIDGVDSIGPDAAGPAVEALTANGFTATPRGLRLRTGAR